MPWPFRKPDADPDEAAKKDEEFQRRLKELV